MSCTVVRVVSETGIPVTFIAESDLESTLTNVRGLALIEGATSLTVLAGLLQLTITRPVVSMMDVRLPVVILDMPNRVVKWSFGEGEDVAIESLAPESLNS